MTYRCVHLCLFFLALSASGFPGGSPAARADSWRPPKEEHWSANRRFVLRVDWKQRTLTLKEKRENGFLPRWSITFPQEDAPVEVSITDDGRHVVLRDVWHQVGHGKVLVFLGPSGEVLNTFTLEQLLTAAEILDAPMSISSIWWSQEGLFFLHRRQTQYAFFTRKGTVRVFDLVMGQRVALTPETERAVRSEALRRVRKDLAHSDPDRRMAAASQAGFLGDRSSIPTLRRLLDDRASGGRISWVFDGQSGRYESHGVQYAAGEALLALLGSRAGLLFERQLIQAAPLQTAHWLWLLAQTGEARSSPIVRRLTRSPDHRIRRAAIEAMLAGDDGTLLHRNIRWATDHDPYVRSRALEILSEHARKEDAQVLRAALNDRHMTNALWALRALIRLKPHDLDAILRRCAQRRDAPEADDAIIELARRGDAASLRRILSWVQSLSSKQPGEVGGSFDVQKVCRFLAERKDPQFAPALKAASQISSLRVRRSVFGALAALGDAEAFKRLREFARQGEPLDRAMAIEWLGFLKDRTSLDFLRQQLRDPEPWVRDAAKEAMARIQGQPVSE
jgi:HEAT repeat protein